MAEYQVTYNSEHVPAFGLDMFNNETEAMAYAYALLNEKKEQIKVTLFEDTAAIRVIWEAV